MEGISETEATRGRFRDADNDIRKVLRAAVFERGFGTTVGNALRRVLLSSIEGAAITAVKIEGLHEFSSLPGVVEDVTDIILNLKQIPIKLHGATEKILTLDIERKGKVTAADLQATPRWRS